MKKIGGALFAGLLWSGHRRHHHQENEYAYDHDPPRTDLDGARPKT
jgi:hypothetical protein